MNRIMLTDRERHQCASLLRSDTRNTVRQAKRKTIHARLEPSIGHYAICIVSRGGPTDSQIAIINGFIRLGQLGTHSARSRILPLWIRMGMCICDMC